MDPINNSLNLYSKYLVINPLSDNLSTEATKKKLAALQMPFAESSTATQTAIKSGARTLIASRDEETLGYPAERENEREEISVKYSLTDVDSILGSFEKRSAARRFSGSFFAKIAYDSYVTFENKRFVSPVVHDQIAPSHSPVVPAGNVTAPTPISSIVSKPSKGAIEQLKEELERYKRAEDAANTKREKAFNQLHERPMQRANPQAKHRHHQASQHYFRGMQQDHLSTISAPSKSINSVMAPQQQPVQHRRDFLITLPPQQTQHRPLPQATLIPQTLPQSTPSSFNAAVEPARALPTPNIHTSQQKPQPGRRT